MSDLTLPALLERRSPLRDGVGFEKILLITINHSYAGFFAYVTFVINQLIYAEKKRLLPVVYFGPRSGDGPNAFYDSAMGGNSWDYYFEPVAGWTYDEIRALVDSPASSISEKDLVRLSREELWYLHREDPDSVYNYPYGYYQHLSGDSRSWYARQRRKASGIIERYVRVKPEILSQLDDWVDAHFQGERVLGIHMRGTDKGGAGPVQPHLMRVMTPDMYFPLIDQDSEQWGAGKIFLATDQRQFVDVLRDRYGERVMALEAIRSSSSVNPFQVSDSKNYLKGKEVLLDCLILSKCDFLLKCTSAVGEYAMYFNPDLGCIDVNHLKERPVFGDSLRVSWNRAKSLGWEGETRGWRKYARRYLAIGPLRFLIAEAAEQRRHSSHIGWRALVIAKDALGSLLTRGALPLSLVRYRARSARRRRGTQLFDAGNASLHKVLEIRIDDPGDSGLFAQLHRILAQLHFADAHHLTPVVTLDQPSNRYLQRGRGENVWDYYFEPASALSTTELDDLDPIEITLLGPDDQRCLALGAGNHDIDPPSQLDEEGVLWFRRRRAMATDLVSAHVKIKPAIADEADAFYREHLQGEVVLGVHMPAPDPTTRTAAGAAQAGTSRSVAVMHEVYFPFIEAFIGTNSAGRIFLATNDSTLVDRLRTRFGTAVVSRRAARSNPATEFEHDLGYQGGAEVLIDMLLLSRSDFLLHCASPVGEFATFFNSGLPALDLSYPCSVEQMVL
jgi:hypothetical protein